MKLSKKTKVALKRSTCRSLKEAKTKNPFKKIRRKRDLKRLRKRAEEANIFSDPD
jgi:hypothetical protein